jgi:GT2 family glycosyltransferase
VRERVTLVVPVFNQIEMTTGLLESLRSSTEAVRLVVIDNGSTDGTREMFRDFPYPYPLHFIENDDNTSVIASLNRAWPAVETEFLCILHNDTEIVDPACFEKLVDTCSEPGVGMAGLYGVKRVRRDGRFVGRTIVHSLAEGPTVQPPGEDVVVIDALCMCLRRRVLEELGGLDERYGFYHGFDKDLSLAIRERGLRSRVVYAPFRHHGGGTRARDFARDPERERRDLALRHTATAHLLAKWGHRLPADARARGTRVREWLRSRYPWRR